MATTGLSLQKATQESFRYVTPEACHYSEALGWVKSPFSQKDWKCILTSALSPDSGSQPGTDSNCYSPTVPGTQVSLTTRPRPTVSIPWAAATKTRVLDGKAGAHKPQRPALPPLSLSQARHILQALECPLKIGSKKREAGSHI